MYRDYGDSLSGNCYKVRLLMSHLDIAYEQQLVRGPFFVGDRLTIADISLHAYTQVADEGGFSLTDYPAVRRWLARIVSDPRHVSMPKDRR